MELFEVQVEAVAYVWAKDRLEAERIAETERDVMDGAEFTASKHGAKDAIWYNWTNCIPFGDAPEGFDNLDMDEIHAKWEGDDPQPESDPYTLPLPFN